MFAPSADTFTILLSVILMQVLPPVLHLKTFLRIGCALSVVLPRMILSLPMNKG